MGRLIVEIATLHGARARFESFEDSFTVGRAYDNDLVLADRATSPHHVCIRPLTAEEREMARADRPPGSASAEWRVEDLGSENGVRHHGRVYRGDPLNVASGEEIVLGRTRLRLFAPDHPVAPTEKLGGGLALFTAERPLVCWLVVLGALCGFALLTFLSTDGHETGETVGFAVLGAALLAVGWAAVWALVGRVLRHRPAFSAHAAVMAGALFASVLSDELAGWIGFVLPRIWVAPLILWFVTFVVTAATTVVSLRLATNLRRAGRWAAALSVATLLSALVLYSVIDPLIDTPYPVFSSRLRPLPSLLVPTESVEEFLDETEAVFGH